MCNIIKFPNTRVPQSLEEFRDRKRELARQERKQLESLSNNEIVNKIIETKQRIDFYLNELEIFMPGRKE